LDPGDRWQRELYRNIDGCDLFLLFWSASAKKSKWVRREVRYALERKGRDEFAPPEIRPVIVAASAGCPAVAGGQHIHFGDWLAYVIQAEDRTDRRSPAL
jgi:TIR domain